MIQFFIVNGMHCQACTKLTAKRIQKIDGVTDVKVDLTSKTADVETNRLVTAEEINQQLMDTNYQAEERI